MLGETLPALPFLVEQTKIQCLVLYAVDIAVLATYNFLRCLPEFVGASFVYIDDAKGNNSPLEIVYDTAYNFGRQDELTDVEASIEDVFTNIVF